MPGNNVLVDSDAMIGLMNENDALHKRALSAASFLQKNLYASVILYPTVLEAATALAKDKTIRRPDLAKIILERYAAIDESATETAGVARLTAELYEPNTSKKNTPFDYYLLSYAKQNRISVVFSFDAFYRKNGLTLLEELMFHAP